MTPLSGERSVDTASNEGIIERSLAEPKKKRRRRPKSMDSFLNPLAYTKEPIAMQPGPGIGTNYRNGSGSF